MGITVRLPQLTPWKIPVPCCPQMPLGWCCGPGTWHPAWHVVGEARAPSALASGLFWGAAPFPQVPGARPLQRLDLLDFIFQHRFELNPSHVASVVQVLEAVLLASLLCPW